MSAFKISTQLRGNIVVIGFNEDICGISWRMSKTRKYAFAKRWNCSNKFFGKNVIILYLDVDTALFYYDYVLKKKY